MASRLGSVLLWSVIAAAFIGPGTVTTCAAAGAGFGMALLWALAFSTFACIVLQEAAARVTAASGRDLGAALRERFAGRVGGAAVTLLVLGAIVVGCAAYEAGNILGSVAGAALQVDLPRPVLVLAAGIPAAVLLASAAAPTVARILGVLVAVMGTVFLATALMLAPPPAELLRGLLVPRVPQGASLLVLGLIGTTVVPYNLFLGSGLSRGRTPAEVRFGLVVAIVLGGLISMGVVVVGTAVPAPFSFEALAGTLADRLGSWAAGLFALGLFAAGFSSAITAPLAAAITARGLFAREGGPRWDERSGRYRAVWAGVLVAGLLFALTDVRPVPAIVAAQALNGVILPFVAVFLLIVVNDASVMGGHRNRWPSNLAMTACVAVSVLLGTAGVLRAAAAATAGTPPSPRTILIVALVVLVPVAVAVLRTTSRRGRR